MKICPWGGEDYRNKEGWFMILEGKNTGHLVCKDWDALCTGCFSKEEQSAYEIHLQSLHRKASEK